ncbi:retrovirus-related pol polyprotein from transposon TNT 1-94 [Tanacetum coccineum]
MNHQTLSVPQIAYQSPQVSTQPITESPLVDLSIAFPVFSPGADLIACLNKAMAFLTVDKAMLAEAQEAGQVLNEEQLTFLADLGVPDGQAVQKITPNNAAFQIEDLDTYDSDCDDISNGKSGFSWPQKIFPTMVLTLSQDDIIKGKLALKEQVDSLEQNLSKQIKENECLLQTFTVFKSESKEKEDTYIENEIYLEKKIKELDNILFKVAQRIKPTLYDGIAMSDKHVVMPVIDDEKTLILEEASRSKMSEKAKDPEVINKNISYKPIDYEKLNRLTEDFGKCFTPQQELLAEQAFWLRMSDPTSKPSDALPVKIEARKELHKVSLVNQSLKKLKFHLAKFDYVVKIRTTPNARTEGEWGFEHTKAVFNNEIIPFLKSLKDIFNVFDRDLLNEIMEVKTVFDQMDAAVQQSSVDKQCLEIAKKELLLENDRLLQQIMSQYVLVTVMNSMSLIGETVNMDGDRKEYCNLEAKLLKSQNAFNDLLKSYSQLEKYCISLELLIQLNQEIFQKDDSCNNQNALEILEFFKTNDLKAQLPDKDSTIYTYPNAINLSAKNVVVTPKNKVKKVRIEVFYFLRIKNEAPEAIIKCIKNIQVRLNATVRNVRTDNGTEFVNQTIREFYENVGITHQTSVARTPQQNNVVERRNQTLLMQDKKLGLSFFHVFGALYYPTNDNDDLGKLDTKVDIGVFVGYAPAKKAFRIYNKRTQKIIETILVTFDELTAMASEQFSSGLGL